MRDAPGRPWRLISSAGSESRRPAAVVLVADPRPARRRAAAVPLDAILHGFAVALESANLLFLVVGVVLGTVIGMLPGIGPSPGVALLIPVGFGMAPTAALIMMAGVYHGAMYGGSTTSILLNAPGEAASVMTAIGGYQMARKGRPGAALAISAVGSFIAGTLGIVALTLLALPIAEAALEFGPPEYFALVVFALIAVASLSGEALLESLAALAAGLAISTVGIEPQSGIGRFTFGLAELDDGIDCLIVVVGLFAVAESLVGLEEIRGGLRENVRLTGPVWLTLAEWRRSRWPILRGTVIGFVTGVLPGAGAAVASVMSCTAERRLPEVVGHSRPVRVPGPDEGVAERPERGVPHAQGPAGAPAGPPGRPGGRARRGPADARRGRPAPQGAGRVPLRDRAARGGVRRPAARRSRPPRPARARAAGEGPQRAHRPDRAAGAGGARRLPRRPRGVPRRARKARPPRAVGGPPGPMPVT